MKNTELLAGQQFKANVSARLRAGRERTAGRAKGSLDEIIARQVHEIITPDMSKNTSEDKNTFGLSEVEKKSIEADINAEKPIGDTPAYRVFLKNIFPNKELIFPYLADHDDALIVVSKLGELFGKKVRLPNKEQALRSLKNNHHFTGFRRAGDGGVEVPGDVGYAWISGEMRGGNAPCAWRDRNGHANYFWFNRRSGRSVIPIFG